MLCLLAIETAGAWNAMAAVELVQEIGRRITVVTQQPIRKTTFLFQRLSIALQQGKLSLSKTQ